MDPALLHDPGMIFPISRVRRLTSGFWALSLLLVSLSAILSPQAASAQAPGVSPNSGAIIIATREAPPFAMKGEDGHWEGLAIELWRSVAESNGFEYTLVESDLAGMIDGVAAGQYDASVGALTITQAREESVDFSHPFYATGFGIATRKGSPGWLALIGQFFTWDFLQTLLILVGLLAFVGMLFWLAERRRNSEEFPEDARGVGSGFWFAAVTMTTVGYGDKAPRTPAGKMVALVWMFTALLIISTITGMIASALTAGRLEGQVNGPSDLDGVEVGTLARSAGEQWLSRDGVGSRSFATLEEGLAALAAGEIDAFVHDEPLLRYRIGRGKEQGLRVLPGSFGRQDYGIALPEESALREGVNLALLHHIESDAWLAHVTDQPGRSE